MADYTTGGATDAANETTRTVTRADRAAESNNLDAAPIDATQRKALETWLGDTLPERLREMRRDERRWARWRTTLRGERPRKAARRGASNLSVPLMIWAVGSTRARIDRSTWGLRPTVAVRAYPGSNAGADNEDNALTASDLKAIAEFFEHELYNPNALNGRNSGRQVIASQSTLGTGAWKVYVTPRRRLTTAQGVRVLEGRPRWEFIARDDLIFWDGYGLDTQAMPYVGHLKTVTQVMVDELAGYAYYDKTAASEVRALYGRESSTEVLRQSHALPAFLREHDVAELYLEFPLKAGEAPAALVVDYHVLGGKLLRVDWNRNPRGYRPIFVAQFDEPADPSRLDGQGVCEKLEGAQEEADETHNIGIEAAKRAAANLVVVKGGGDLEEQVTDAMDSLPGEVVTSDNPDGDINSVQLGNSNAAQFLVSLADHTSMYVMQILGFSGASQGDVTAGKRVPASLGLNISQESKIPMAHATQTLTEAMENALYLTIDLYKRVLPEAAMAELLTPEVARKLYRIVFSPVDVDVRRQLAVTVSAQDASAEEERARQEILYLTQFLFGFFDRLLQYGQLAVQAPPPIRNILLDVIEKMQNSVKLLLARITSIPNPDVVIPDVAGMIADLNGIGSAISGVLAGAAAGATNSQPAGGPTPVNDYGGGVA